MRQIVLPLITLLFAACAGESGDGIITKKGDLITLQIDEVGEDRVVKIALSEFIEDIEFLQLDPDIENTVTEVRYMSENYIIGWMSGVKALRLFDSKSGEFIANIGSVGRGRGEFTYPDIIYVDETSERIYVANMSSPVLNMYGMDGKYIKSIPYANEMRGIAAVKVDTQSEIVTVFCRVRDSKKMVWQQDFDGNEIKSAELECEYDDSVFSSIKLVGDDASNKFTLSYFSADCAPPIYRYDDKNNSIDTTFMITFKNFDKFKGGSASATVSTSESKDYIFSKAYLWKRSGENSMRGELSGAYVVNKSDLSYGNLEIEDDILNILSDIDESLFVFNNDYMYVSPVYTSSFKYIEKCIDDALESDIEPELRARLHSIMDGVDKNGNLLIIRGRLK